MGHDARADSGLCCAVMMAVEKQIGLPGAKVPGTRVCHQKKMSLCSHLLLAFVICAQTLG